VDVKIKARKCVLLKNKLIVWVSRSRQSNSAKVKAVKDFPKPKSSKEVKA